MVKAPSLSEVPFCRANNLNENIFEQWDIWKRLYFCLALRVICPKCFLAYCNQIGSVLGICGARQFDEAQRLRSKLSWFANEVGLSVDQDLIYESPFENLSEPFDIADLAEFQNFTWQNFTTIVSPNICQSLKPDLILVAGFPKLIPEQIYQKAKLGAFNFHPSLLPNYKGGTPNRWVVRDSAPETGITAHRLTDEFDAGEIVLNTKILVEKKDSWGDVETKIIERLPAFTFKFFGKFVQTATCSKASTTVLDAAFAQSPRKQTIY